MLWYFLSSIPSGPLSITKAWIKKSYLGVVAILSKCPCSSQFLVWFFLLFFIISMTINDFYYSDSRAQPLSSFPRQEITVGVRDGLQVATNTQTKVDYKDKLDNSSDIQKVTYFSDGKTLNVTLWLGDTMPENPTREGANNLVYGILIDVDNNPTTENLELTIKKKFNGITQHDSGITLSLNIPRLVTLGF